MTTKIALLGAGGKMGQRITNNLKDLPEYEIRYVEVSPVGIAALAEMGIELDGVVNIQVSEDEVQRRLGGRLSCPTSGCGASYHVEFHAPKAEVVGASP